MAGKPVGIVLAGVALFLAAVVMGRLVLAFGVMPLVLATPILFLVLAARGGWVLASVASALFLGVGLVVALASREPTLALAIAVQGTLAAIAIGIGWRVLRKPRKAASAPAGPKLGP